MKCNKCNHFFAIIPDSETKLNVKDAGNDGRQQAERRPPPPPRKVRLARVIADADFTWSLVRPITIHALQNLL